jgi:hypothetical protein
LEVSIYKARVAVCRIMAVLAAAVSRNLLLVRIGRSTALP